jgi:hypothetical protein
VKLPVLGFLLAVTVTIACAEFVPFNVACPDEILHEVFEGAPVQVSETLPANPFTGSSVMVTDVGLAEIEKSVTV